MFDCGENGASGTTLPTRCIVIGAAKILRTAEGGGPYTDMNPVLWAVKKGITSGLSPDTFDPNNTCTRAQVVTFLYANATK